MLKIWKSIAVAAVLSALSACGLKFDTAGEIKDRRILAIKAEPPELVPSMGSVSVTLTALVVDPGAQPTALDYVWGYCWMAPTARAGGGGGGGFGGPGGGGTTTDARCAADRFKLVATVQGGASPLSQMMPYPAELPAYFPATSTSPAPEIRVQLRVAAPAGDLYGVKKIAVTADGVAPNQNPQLTTLFVDQLSVNPLTLSYGVCADNMKTTVDDSNGAKVTVCSHDVMPSVDPSTIEQYQDTNTLTGQLETRKERYTFSWFVDAGSLSADTTSQPDPRLQRPVTEGVGTVWNEPTAKPTAPVHIWVVVRDGHGGVTWDSRTVNFQ